MSSRRRWPESSGTWTPLEPPHTIVVAPHADSDHIVDLETIVVTTPLDLIARLEVDALPITTIILSGRFAGDATLCKFLREMYPSIRVLAAPHGHAIPRSALANTTLR